MKNVTIGYGNKIDTATLSGGSWQATLPLNNLKNRRLSKLARSTNATNAFTKFVVDLGSAQNVQCIALILHNISVSGTVQIKGNATNVFTAPSYDSGVVQAYSSGVIPPELLEWEEDNFWLGTLSQQALAGYRAPFFLLLPSAQFLRYWQFELFDASNPDGYLQIGRVFIGKQFTPTRNMAYGQSLGDSDDSIFETSLTGEEFIDQRTTFRTHKFELQLLSKTEAYSGILDIQRTTGITKEIFLVGDNDDTSNINRRSFLGRFKMLNPIVQKTPSLYSCQFEIKEII